MALVAIGPAAVPFLEEALAGSEGGVPDPLVVWALGEIGPGARSSAPLLESVLRSEHAGLRRRAALAIGKIAPVSSGIPALQRALEDPDKLVRLAAVEALENIERRSEKAAP